ncbi:hypothetical protein PHLCEN_2v8860 [Hermanssonia centrifuga]|uniref:Uncharacterized protein n=1 Tax=Hermanssonia centrifuga TaxID=98765 RepID=A0A2R6NSE6_9APHY|nr:hypothetical protein PHLCEN_2v8860 [Hermanssonia centrifuga]
MAARSPSSADSNSARNDTDGVDDKAVEITYDSQDVHLAGTVRWKTDLWVLPIASMIYFLSFLGSSLRTLALLPAGFFSGLLKVAYASGPE